MQKINKDEILNHPEFTKANKFLKDKFILFIFIPLFVVQGTNYVDENVTPNKEYEYRVKAVNEAGEGEPSDSSGNIAAKPEKGK